MIIIDIDTYAVLIGFTGQAQGLLISTDVYMLHDNRILCNHFTSNLNIWTVVPKVFNLSLIFFWCINKILVILTPKWTFILRKICKPFI